MKIYHQGSEPLHELLRAGNSEQDPMPLILELQRL